MATAPADNNKYEILEKIGHGSFGVIRKVRRKADAKIQCRKEINYLKMSMKEREQLHAEFSILSTLNHPNIVQYYHREHIKASQDLYIYMEYCGGGDLGMIIRDLKKNGQLAKEDFVWRIFAQLVTALYRCHNGVDAPEPGNNPFAQPVKHTDPKSKVMILHRDLKPENVFLGEDHAVKLGDFGLSKIMSSHDFASTYVGTPFYMSPEICNAEKYTSASDIWALGCIMHELCTTDTPFDAKTHLQLIQKIRKCELQKQVPSVYSRELRNVITSCLNVNPNRRPDTASLLTIPYVWIARKGMEMVDLGKDLKGKEYLASQRLQSLESDQVAFRQETESQLRREWEVKARLEINRQVEKELEKLRRRFDKEVYEKVQAIIAKHNRKVALGHFTAESHALKERPNPPAAPAPAAAPNTEDKENAASFSHGSSLSTTGTTTTGTEDDSALSADFTDLTNLSNLSLDSPCSSTTKAPPDAKSAAATTIAKKATKTPFARSKTTFDSPADIVMAEPSPITISSLALSPRRNAAAQAAATHNSRNIFAEDASARARQRAELNGKPRWEPTLPGYSSENEVDGRHHHSSSPAEEGNEENDDDEEEDSEDDLPELPSPTRPKLPAHLVDNNNNKNNTRSMMNKDPFKVPMRPGLGARQMTTATMQKLTTQPTLFPSTATTTTTTSSSSSNPHHHKDPATAANTNTSVRATAIPAPTLTNANANATAAGGEGPCLGLGLGTGLQRANSDAGIAKARSSPDRRRMSKIPSSAAHLLVDGGSPTRTTTTNGAGGGMLKSKAAATAPSSGGLGLGFGLAHLAQARAGGRPPPQQPPSSSTAVSRVGVGVGVGAVGATGAGAGEGVKFAARLAEREREAEKENGSGSANGSGNSDREREREGEREAVAVWDPEREVEMPSPFLVRRKALNQGVGFAQGVGMGMMR